MTQSGFRIVGLSATLPNYIDVASFLRVNPDKGIFSFDGRFRPVPLSHKNTFGGMRELRDQLDAICYKEVLDLVRRGHQVLVFVHARNATATLAQRFRELAAVNVIGDLERFLLPSVATTGYIVAKKSVQASRNGLLFSNFQYGMDIHHVGLHRSDRSLMEKMFAQGYIQVLCCTSTLAWGVNLPAHAVVIHGTGVFDSEKGAFTDLGVLDVCNKFSGVPVGLNSKMKQKTLYKYLVMLIRQAPIESQFFNRIHDNLNAEIALGTVSTVHEAVEWLSYTCYHFRARINPIVDQLPHNVMIKDPNLRDIMTQKVQDIYSQLDTQQRIRFDSLNRFLSACDLGRITSQFYIKCETIEMLNGSATEFAQLKVREEEMNDLDEMTAPGCFFPIRGGGLASIPGKVKCLLQCFFSRCFIKSFSLALEALYVQLNVTRFPSVQSNDVLYVGSDEFRESIGDLASHTLDRLIQLLMREPTPLIAAMVLEHLVARTDYVADEQLFLLCRGLLQRCRKSVELRKRVTRIITDLRNEKSYAGANKLIELKCVMCKV
ncbi:unnamed protein product, partial [Mesorhabditis spiculigera]